MKKGNNLNYKIPTIIIIDYKPSNKILSCN